MWDSGIADDALWERLHASFTTEELVELGFFIALTFGQQHSSPTKRDSPIQQNADPLGSITRLMRANGRAKALDAGVARSTVPTLGWDLLVSADRELKLALGGGRSRYSGRIHGEPGRTAIAARRMLWETLAPMQQVDDRLRPEDSVPSPAGPGRLPYETPRLICYGHVRTLTAGTKLGLNDISLNSSIV